MKNKTVLLVTPSFPPATSGAATYFSNLVNKLKSRQSWKIIVLTTSNSDTKLIEKKDGYFIYRLIPNMLHSFFLLRILILPLFSFISIFYISLKYRIELIHCHSSTAITLGISFYSVISRKKLIFEVQDLMALSWLMKLGNIQFYIATGNQIKNRLVSFGISKQKILTITSIPPESCRGIKLMKKKNDSLTFIYVGSLDKKVKGIDILLQSFQTLLQEKKDIRLKIIGFGPDKDFCENYISTQELQEKIFMLGSKSNQETLHEIANSDILILPSNSEGVPRVILEAFSVAVPVIASGVGGVPDIVNNNNGILVPSGDRIELYKAMQKLANNTLLCQQLGENAARYVKTLPTWDELTDQIIEVYNKV
ncbi:glycosyltransferase family 4 protein [Patescibacteria group bacterium]|nr:glycosyltransferase family 4 protein [Patescibacteria group bacterium]